MSEPSLPAQDRRNVPAKTYLTPGETAALSKLGESYAGSADVLRQGLALLIRTRHPELLKSLREDLRIPLEPSA